MAPLDLAAGPGGAYGAEAIRLDANENPYPPLADGPLAAGLNRYPEPQSADLRAVMAALYAVDAANVLLTRFPDGPPRP